MKTCDLHAHSYYSDGSLSPAQLVAEAEKAGLSAVVLSDHNTVAGLPEFMAAGKKSTVRTVPAVEFSTEYRETELHILGLFITPDHYGQINALLQQFLQRKELSNRALIDRLNSLGMHMSYDEIRQTAAGRINRAVIGAQMVRLGYCRSVQEAFEKWLSQSVGYYVPPKRPDAFEIIRFIRSIGAVPVLAHPFLNLDEQALRQFLPPAIAAGLVGMEVYYARYSEQTTKTAQKIAAQFSLAESGGSDFHGANKPDIALGIGTGNLCIPLSLLEKLETYQSR